MNISTITLFLGFLLFAGFNFVLNAHITRGDWMKKITVVLGFLSLFTAGGLLVYAFILYIKA